MRTFTREEQKLLLFLGGVALLASAVLLAVPGYADLVPLTRGAAQPPPSGSSSPGRRLDPNFATYEELLAVPGVGPTLARAIMVHREGHILFTADDMLAIRGVGRKTWAGLEPYFAFGPAAAPASRPATAPTTGVE